MQHPHFLAFAEAEAARLIALHRPATAAHYRAAAASLRRFLGRDIMPAAFTPQLAARYEAALRQSGLARNTSSFYLRTLRTLYRRAGAPGNPFHGLYMGFDDTTHRALALADLRRLRDLPLADPRDRLARDIFLFAFYAQGLSFIDLYHLPALASPAVFAYTRRKTGSPVSVALTPDALALLRRLPSTDAYLLPLHALGTAPTVQRLLARHIRRVGRLAGLRAPLTLYAARHTYASLARQAGVPLAVISQAMGHRSEAVTRVYLASISHDELAHANAKLCRLVGKTPSRIE